MRAPRDPIDRLVDKCEWRGDCLVWTGATVRGLYGTFRPGTRSTDPKVYVHRFVFEQTEGPIPEGHDLDHVKAVCTTGLCILPWHVEPVTHRVNMERARLDLCRAGLHDLTRPENVRWDSDGNRRGCKRCWLDRAKARYHERKAA